MNRKNEQKRVVITGLGVVSSIGIGWQEFWKNLIAGKSGITPIEGLDTNQYGQMYAGQIKNFDLTQFFGNRSMNHLGRTSQMALAATKLAIADAQLDYTQLKDNKVGVSIGTTMGEPQLLEFMDSIMVTHGVNEVNPRLLPVYPSNGISTAIARSLSLFGDNFVIANACSAGNYSFGHSFDNIKLGKTDMMIAGGADSFSKMNIAGFSRLLAVAPDRCQPFDKNRKGLIVGEGAGIVVIETLESARKRGVSIYAEILGYGLSCDAQHMTSPDSNGISKAIIKALKACDIKPEDVDYICAHGTGTDQNDKNEAKAIKDIFYTNGRKTPASSIKSMLGHTMGAASAIEGIACCLAIKYNMIPPTINYEEVDPECEIDCVPNCSRILKIKIAANNSFAFGGNNLSLLLKYV